MNDPIEGRNPVFECLTRNRRRVRHIWLDRGARQDERIDKILAIAKERGIAVDIVDRLKLDKMADGRVHNGIIADADPLPDMTTSNLLEICSPRGAIRSWSSSTRSRTSTTSAPCCGRASGSASTA